jgi:DHA3 family tetracycline resistance protein-like MFS transporter
MGQADALGQVGGGPTLGAVANLAGVPVALALAGGLQLPTAFIYLRLRPNRVESAGAMEIENPSVSA